MFIAIQGIFGCGIATAHAVARGNLGVVLLHKASQTSTPTAEFLEFVISWRRALCTEFLNDPHGHLGHKCKSIASAIAETPSFPDVAVIFAYVNPITSWSVNHSIPPYHSCGLAVPNPAEIARFCQFQFRWDAAVIAKKFSKGLFLGIAIQSLLKVLTFRSRLNKF